MITHALATDPPWLKRAFTDLGLQELPGAAARPRIVEMYAKAGHPEVTSDKVAWCSAALNTWMLEANWRACVDSDGVWNTSTGQCRRR
jgi:hypothetical protein